MLKNRLKMKREEKKLTQDDLAKKVNVTKGTISNYENGHSTPSNEMLRDLADILNTTTDYLLGRSEENLITPTFEKSVDKDEKDIAKRMEEFRKDLTKQDGLSFNGEPMSEEAIESLSEAMEYAFRQTQRINKKYIPKKHRKDDNEE